MGVVIAKKDPPKPITAKQLRALVKSFPWDEWNKKLAPELEQVYRDLVVSQGAAAADAGGVSFDQDDPFLQQHMTAYIGERITQLSRTSQKDVTRALRNSLSSDEDLSPAKLQEKVLGAVRRTYEGYEAFRALRIARTESAIAYNHGGVLGSLQAGFKTFEVVDGTDDDECAAANGKVWSATECLNNPIAHPNAVFAGTRVLPLGHLAGAYRALWSGPAVRLRTAMGTELPISPNHPVLTSRGWIPAKGVRHGDYVIHHRGLNLDDTSTGSPRVSREHLQDRQALIEQIFESLLSIPGHTRVVAAATHFHGDGNFCQGEVDIVRTDGFLSNEGECSALEQTCQPGFVIADAELESFARLRAEDLALQRILTTAPGSMGRGDVGRVISSAPNLNTGLTQPIPNHAVADLVFLCELQSRCAGLVTLDQVTDVADVDTFVGHAFDLETSSRSYFANGLLVHNCVRAFFPIAEEGEDGE